MNDLASVFLIGVVPGAVGCLLAYVHHLRIERRGLRVELDGCQRALDKMLASHFPPGGRL